MIVLGVCVRVSANTLSVRVCVCVIFEYVSVLFLSVCVSVNMHTKQSSDYSGNSCLGVYSVT